MSSKLQVFVDQTKDYLKHEQERLDLLLKKCQVNLVVSPRWTYSPLTGVLGSQSARRQRVPVRERRLDLDVAARRFNGGAAVAVERGVRGVR